MEDLKIEEALTTSQAAKRLLSPRRRSALIREDRLVWRKVGRDYLVSRESVDAEFARRYPRPCQADGGMTDDRQVFLVREMQIRRRYFFP